MALLSPYLPLPVGGHKTSSFWFGSEHALLAEGTYQVFNKILHEKKYFMSTTLVTGTGGLETQVCSVTRVL